MLLDVSRVKWRQHHYEDVKKWFQLSVMTDPDNEDAWLFFHMFLDKEGGDMEKFLTDFLKAAPRQGDLWCI